jgi:hypothetical protein
MRITSTCMGVLLGVRGVMADEVDQCSDTELACHDIMNSSQCIAQVALNEPVSKEAMIKCVEHEGTASNLPGAAKVCLPDFASWTTWYRWRGNYPANL